MLSNGKNLEQAALTRLLRMNAVISGIVTGVIVGLSVFASTMWLVFKGGDVVGPHLSLLGQFFIGYSVTFGGSLLGLAYGLIAGFFIGFFVAKLYNWLVDLREGSEGRDR